MDEEVFDYYQEREEHTIQMAEAQLEEQEELDAAEEALDPALLCWANINDNDDRCRVLTGFTCEEFLELLGHCEHAIPVALGRGRRTRASNHDKFLMILCYVKHYETQGKIGETFHVSKTQINRVLDETIKAIAPLLYARYVENVAALLEPDELDENEFEQAKFVMDATFQEIWTPLGNYDERERFFSDKHKAYGLKTQCHDHSFSNVVKIK